MKAIRNLLTAILVAVSVIGATAPLFASHVTSYSAVTIYAAGEPTPTPEHPDAPIDCPGGC